MIKRFAFITGLLFLLIAITNFVVWFIIATSAKSFDEAVNDYINLYPKFIENPITLTLLNILLLAMAIGCFIFSIQKNSSSFFKRLCYGLIILSGILAFWNLFSLM
jgi:uncharacterized membrane protein